MHLLLSLAPTCFVSVYGDKEVKPLKDGEAVCPAIVDTKVWWQWYASQYFFFKSMKKSFN